MTVDENTEPIGGRNQHSTAGSSLGSELRKLRSQADLSLAALARQVHYSKGHLSRVETGSKTPSVDLARMCDRVLRTGGILSDMLTLGPETRPVMHQETAPDQEKLFSHLRTDSGADVTTTFDESQTTLTVLRGTVRRPVTAAMVTAFRHQFIHVRQAGRALPADAVIPSLLTQIHTLRHAARSATGAVPDDLLKLAGWIAEYLGWMAQESGDDHAAVWWTQRATSWATAAGDTDIAAYALVRRALIALYQQDSATTVTLAQQAQAASGTSRRVQGLAAQREAQGHALAGNRDACARALDRASALLTHHSCEEAPQPMIGMSSVANPVGLVAGCCWLDLDDSEQGVAVLTRELAAVPADAVRTRARFGVRLFGGLLTIGDHERGWHLGRLVLDDAAAIDSATVRADLRLLVRQLRRHRSHDGLAELDLRLTELLRTGRRAH